jgi:hypothetical protein
VLLQLGEMSTQGGALVEGGRPVPEQLRQRQHAAQQSLRQRDRSAWRSRKVAQGKEGRKRRPQVKAQRRCCGG